MAQAYTLKLNIAADASQAIAEADRAKKAFAKLHANAGGAAAPSASAPANAASALPDSAGNCSALLQAIRTDVAGILNAMGAKPSAAANAASAIRGGRAAAVFGAVGTAVGTVGKLFSGVMGAVLKAVKTVYSFVKGAFTYCWEIPLKALKALTIAVGALGAAAYAAKKLLDPAGKMQSFRAQLEVMVKDPRIAARRLAVLSKYAKDTNYGPDEVIGAGNMLQAYGIYSFRYLKAAGDAANAFGRSIAEVVQSLSYLKGGRGGEAMESLSRFGVTRDKLRAYGIKFGKQGQLKTSIEKTLDTVIQVFEDEYGGMTQRIGKTWNGAIQQLGGEVFDSLAKGFQRAVRPATEFITGTLIPLINDAGKALAAIDWQKHLAPLMNGIHGFAGIVGAWLDPRSRGMADESFARLWDGARKFGATIAQGLGKVFTGAIESLAKTLGNFIGEGGIQRAFGALGNILMLVGQTFVASVKTIFDAFPDKLRISLGLLLDKIPGVNTGVTDERNKYLDRVFTSAMIADQQLVPMFRNGKAMRNADGSIRQETTEEQYAAELGMDLKGFQAIRAQMLASANRAIARKYEGIKFKTIEELFNAAEDGDAAAGLGYSYIHSEDYRKKFYDRNNAAYLTALSSADRPLSHFDGIQAQIAQTIDSIGELLNLTAGSVETAPLRNAVKEVAEDLKASWQDGIAPVLGQGRNLAAFRSGKMSRHAFLLANYGEEAAAQFAAPYLELQAKYPRGRKWNYKEFRRDRADAVRQQREIFDSITSGRKAEEEQKDREEIRSAWKNQNSQMERLQKTMDKLEDAIAPIARAYA